MTDPRLERLPCGRDKDQLLEIVAEDRSLMAGCHEATCHYCQAALEELRGLWSLFRRWAGRPTPAPAQLVRRIIARVRRITQSPHHVVASTAKGVTSVTSWVIGVFGTQAALRVPGVASVGKSGPPSHGGTHSNIVRQGADDVNVTEVGAAAVSLQMALVVRPVSDLPRLADAVRREVMSELRRSADLEVFEVNVSVDDVDLEEFSKDRETFAD